MKPEGKLTGLQVCKLAGRQEVRTQKASWQAGRLAKARKQFGRLAGSPAASSKAIAMLARWQKARRQLGRLAERQKAGRQVGRGQGSILHLWRISHVLRAACLIFYGSMSYVSLFVCLMCLCALRSLRSRSLASLSWLAALATEPVTLCGSKILACNVHRSLHPPLFPTPYEIP